MQLIKLILKLISHLTENSDSVLRRLFCYYCLGNKFSVYSENHTKHTNFMLAKCRDFNVNASDKVTRML